MSKPEIAPVPTVVQAPQAPQAPEDLYIEAEHVSADEARVLWRDVDHVRAAGARSGRAIARREFMARVELRRSERLRRATQAAGDGAAAGKPNAPAR